MVTHSTPLLDSIDGAPALRKLAPQKLRQLAERGVLDRGLRARTMTLPDRFVDHAKQVEQYEDACLQARNIIETAVTTLGVTKYIREVARR